MTAILAIDPGPTESAYVVYDGNGPTAFGKLGNSELLYALKNSYAEALVIEQVACMGMPAGEELFETVFWSGKFAQAWIADELRHCDRMKRHEVKMFWCNSTRAKDGNIRQAIIDRFGGKDKAIGRKASPGPLYGISGDCWQALALAVCYWETRIARKATP